MREVLFLPISSLHITEKKRKGVSSKRVEEIRRKIECGEEILPIKVFELGDGTYVVRDGRHRIKAHLEAGVHYIAAMVENSLRKITEEIKRRFRQFFGGFFIAVFFPDINTPQVFLLVHAPGFAQALLLQSGGSARG